MGLERFIGSFFLSGVVPTGVAGYAKQTKPFHRCSTDSAANRTRISYLLAVNASRLSVWTEQEIDWRCFHVGV